MPGTSAPRGSFEHVVDELGLVVKQHPAAHADVQRRPPARHLLDVLVAGVAAVQLACLFVDEPDLHGVVVDDLLEQRGDLREELALAERRKERRAEVEQHVSQRQLRLELPARALELLVLARVLDGHRGVRGEDLERLDHVEGRQRCGRAGRRGRGRP